MSYTTEDSRSALSEAVAKISIEAQTIINQLLQETKERLSKQEQSLHEQNQKIKQQEESDMVELNVGGTIFCTTISTLSTIPPNLFSEEDQGQLNEEQQTATDEGNVLSIIASGNSPITKDKQGRIFLDRNGVYFGYILDYLRENGDLKRACIPLKNQEVTDKLCIECEYYGLNRMKYSLLAKGYHLLKNSDNWVCNGDWKWLNERTSEMNKKIGRLLYKGSKHGFTAAAFHLLCDNKGETISIIKSNDNCVFGGYNSNSWTSNGCYSASIMNWLFCFANEVVKHPTQFKLIGNYNEKASYNSPNYSIIFGEGYDLYICDGCDYNNFSYTNIGNTYENYGIKYALNGGKYNFTVEEIEVYQVISK